MEDDDDPFGYDNNPREGLKLNGLRTRMINKSIPEIINFLIVRYGKVSTEEFEKGESNECLHVKGLISFSSLAPKIVRDRKVRKYKTLQYVYLKFLIMWLL